MNTDLITQFAPIVFLFVVFYFLLIRPQQRKMKAHQELIAGLRRGDRVITNGGLIGIVSKIIDDQEIQLEIDENVRVRVLRTMISDISSKPEPVSKETSSGSVKHSRSDVDAKKTKTKSKVSGK